MANEIMSLSAAGKNLEALCDGVYHRGEPAIITQKDGRHLVLMTLEEYQRLTGREVPSVEHLDELYVDLEREQDA